MRSSATNSNSNVCLSQGIITLGEFPRDDFILLLIKVEKQGSKSREAVGKTVIKSTVMSINEKRII